MIFFRNQFAKEQGCFSRSASLVLQNVINSVILFPNNCFLMFSFTHKSLSPCLLTPAVIIESQPYGKLV
jgi:hypothetical protein